MKNWTKEEDDLILKNYEKLSNKDIMQLLSERTLNAISNRAIRLNIKKDKYIPIQIGTIIGRWQIIEILEYDNIKKTGKLKCRCDCGTIKILTQKNLKRGKSNSCGCYKKEILVKRLTKDGKSHTIEYRLLHSAKRRSKAKGHEYNIDYSDIIIPDVCPILGIPIYLNVKGVSSNNSPTLDRIDNNKGYIKGNIKVISHKANLLKSNMSILDIEKIINYIKENINETMD